MWSEIVKFIPQLSSGDLGKMEQSLNSRFMKVAKKFGTGIKNILLGGGTVGVVLALIDKILSPLKEAQEALDRTLNHASDVTTLANQFGTTEGNIIKLQATGKQLGLDPESLNILLEKFQAKVAEAQHDPEAPSSVRQFIGQKDTVSAFAEFIQNLQKMSKNDQILVQENVFGEKQILKMAQFLQGFDKSKLAEGPKAADLTAATQKVNSLDEMDKQITKARELQDVIDKANSITKDFVVASNTSKQIALDKENARLKNFEKLASLDDMVSKMGGQLETIASGIGTLTKIFSNPGGAFAKSALKTNVGKALMKATEMEDPTGRGL